MFQLCHANGCGFASYLGALRFCNSDCLHILIHWTSFSALFLKLHNFWFRGVSFELG